jgi:sec-independent protein translocase protein TatB
MFDIGFWELLIIGIVALVVIGPERLPSFIRSTANTIKSIKNVAHGFKQEVSQQLKTHELHENLKKAEQMGMENIGGDIKRSVDELKAAAASVQTPYKKSEKSEQVSKGDSSLSPTNASDAESTDVSKTTQKHD